MFKSRDFGLWRFRLSCAGKSDLYTSLAARRGSPSDHFYLTIDYFKGLSGTVNLIPENTWEPVVMDQVLDVIDQILLKSPSIDLFRDLMVVKKNPVGWARMGCACRGRIRR
jgi:hypothetical protein